MPIVVLKRGNGLPDPVERRGRRVVEGELEPRRGPVPHQRVTARRPTRVKDSDPQRDEPGAFNVHARICGGPGWATTQVYPAQSLHKMPY